ncbi:MAG: hypothetical protein ACE1ZA_16565, partial [Pseudomonadales bacterium]
QSLMQHKVAAHECFENLSEQAVFTRDRRVRLNQIGVKRQPSSFRNCVHLCNGQLDGFENDWFELKMVALGKGCHRSRLRGHGLATGAQASAIVAIGARRRFVVLMMCMRVHRVLAHRSCTGTNCRVEYEQSEQALNRSFANVHHE